MSAGKPNRREFIKRMSAAAGVAAGSGVLAATFHNRNLVPTGEEAQAIPSYAVPGTEGMLAVAEGTDHALAVRGTRGTRRNAALRQGVRSGAHQGQLCI